MQFWYIMLLLVHLCQTSIGNVDLKDFYPFGAFEGDSTLPRGTDVTSPAVQLAKPIPFGGPKSSIWVSNSGYLSFQGAIPHSPGTAACNKTVSVIAPFKSPVDSLTFGDVYYRQSQDPGLLTQAGATVSQAFGIYNVQFVSMFIATWVGVTFPGFSGAPADAPQNTFQAAIATDGTYSYAIFKYNSIKWTQGDFQGVCGGNNATGIGGACQAEIGYTVANINAVYLDGSCGDAALSIAQRSNIGQPGVWVMRVDNGAPAAVGRTVPGYLNMMGHNSLQVTLPDAFNTSNTGKCTFTDKDKGKLQVPGSFIPGEPKGYSNLLSCVAPFLYSFGDYSYQVDVSGAAGSFSYTGSFFVLLPEPHVTINVVNASLANYMVDLNITWDKASLAAPLATVNITMDVWDNMARMWKQEITIMQGVNNTGQAAVVLVQPAAAIFLTDHLIISVGSAGSVVFSPMFIFDQDNLLRLFATGRTQQVFRRNVLPFLKRPQLPTALGSVSMMGHAQLQVPFTVSSNYTSITCNFQDPVKGRLATDVSVSVDKSNAYCYVPFLYSYGNVQLIVTAKNGVQNVTSNPLTLDVLPATPDVDVLQQFSSTQLLQYTLKLQFSWDPAKVPLSYPYLSAYLFVFDEVTQAWQEGLLVNPTQIHPNATRIELQMSDEAVTAFFDNKVIFGLCYITGDNNWGIFSKIFHH